MQSRWNRQIVRMTEPKLIIFYHQMKLPIWTEICLIDLLAKGATWEPQNNTGYWQIYSLLTAKADPKLHCWRQHSHNSLTIEMLSWCPPLCSTFAVSLCYRKVFRMLTKETCNMSVYVALLNIWRFGKRYSNTLILAINVTEMVRMWWVFSKRVTLSAQWNQCFSRGNQIKDRDPH